MSACAILTPAVDWSPRPNVARGGTPRGPGSNQYGDKPPRQGIGVPPGSATSASLRAQADRAAREHASVQEYLVRRALERVAPNVGVINRTLEQGQRDLGSAERDVAEGNHRRAFQTAYDLTQQAVEAHMNANGLRATSGEGSHKVVVDYAVERMCDIIDERVLLKYEQMRRLSPSRTQVPLPLSVFW